MKNLHTIIFLLLNTVGITQTHPVFDALDAMMVKNNTLVCCGLDPEASKIPEEIMQLTHYSLEERIFLFLQTVIDITAAHVCCYKIQKAFFDPLHDGHNLLHKVITYIHVTYPTIPVFVDCKIGDTSNTMRIYIKNLFEIMKADGIVVNPYMGDDVLEPFMHNPETVALVLVQTSNPGGDIVQECLLADGRPLWKHILNLTLNRWNTHQNLIPIISSNAHDTNWHEVRSLIPQETPMLLAGIGAQGGNIMSLKQLLNTNKRGVFVNSSRDILYPYAPYQENWRDEIKKSVIKLQNQLNEIRHASN